MPRPRIDRTSNPDTATSPTALDLEFPQRQSRRNSTRAAAA